MKTKKGPVVKVKQKVSQALMQKGFTLETIQATMNELNFSQDDETLDNLLQRDLESL